MNESELTKEEASRLNFRAMADSIFPASSYPVSDKVAGRVIASPIYSFIWFGAATSVLVWVVNFLSH